MQAFGPHTTLNHSGPQLAKGLSVIRWSNELCALLKWTILMQSIMYPYDRFTE